jgi:hypothetical protein
MESAAAFTLSRCYPFLSQSGVQYARFNTFQALMWPGAIVSMLRSKELSKSKTERRNQDVTQVLKNKK